MLRLRLAALANSTLLACRSGELNGEEAAAQLFALALKAARSCPAPPSAAAELPSPPALFDRHLRAAKRRGAASPASRAERANLLELDAALESQVEGQLAKAKNLTTAAKICCWFDLGAPGLARWRRLRAERAAALAAIAAAAGGEGGKRAAAAAGGDAAPAPKRRKLSAARRRAGAPPSRLGAPEPLPAPADAMAALAIDGAAPRRRSDDASAAAACAPAPAAGRPRGLLAVAAA
jgi:hypothetical protein